MALRDRALTKAVVAVYNDSGWKNWVDGSTVTPTGGAAIDPIVSGTSVSLYAPKATSTSVSVTIPSLRALGSFTIEPYLYYDSGSTGTLLKLGSSALIAANAAGYVTLTPPYVGSTPVNIDYQTFDSTQFSLVCDGQLYSFYINGVLAYSGTETGAFKTDTTLVFDNDATLNKALGAIYVLNETSGELEVKKRMLEAFAKSTDGASYYDAEVASFVESQTNYSSIMDFPAHVDWNDLVTEGLVANRNGIELELNTYEVYNSKYGCYEIDDIYRFAGSQGSIHVKIPDYALSGSSRGVLHIRSNLVAGDRYTIKLNASNQLQYYKTVMTTDSEGVPTYTPGTPVNIGAALSALADPVVGFLWDSSGIYISLNDAIVHTVASTPDDVFSPAMKTVYIGIDDNLANPYFATEGQWNWEVSLWGVKNATTTNNYGSHTFYMTDKKVKAEASFKIDIPLWTSGAAGEQFTRTPYLWVDGYLATAPTEVLM